MRVRSFILACVLSAALASCGGGDGGSIPTCDTLDFSATGGDVVGQWRLVDACVTVLENPLASQCTDSSMTVSVEDISAVAEYRDDGTLSKTGSTLNIIVYDVAVTCLEDADDTCSGFEADIRDDGKSDPDFVSANCIEKQARCTCTLEIRDSAESGLLWKVEGTKLLTKKSDSGWDDGDDFMVDGDALVRRHKTDQVMSYSIYERL